MLDDWSDSLRGRVRYLAEWRCVRGGEVAVMHLHSTSVDLEATESRLQTAYPSLRIHRRRDHEPFIMEERFDGDDTFHVIEMQLSNGSSSAVDDTGGLLILRSLDQAFRVSNGRRIETTDRPVLVLPGAPVSTSWESGRVQGMLLPAQPLQDHVERPVQTNDHLVRASSVAVAEQWNRFQDYLVQGFLRADGAFENELIRATAEELCLRMILTCFFPPPSHQPAGGRGLMTASVRRAVTFIDEHAHEPITIAEIAEAARLSPRGLQAAFKRHLDTTPFEYLRRARLNGAREELSHPSSGTSVASAAANWGFAHLGRFAGHYRELFGESPRATLQRSRA